MQRPQTRRILKRTMLARKEALVQHQSYPKDIVCVSIRFATVHRNRSPKNFEKTPRSTLV